MVTVKIVVYCDTIIFLEHVLLEYQWLMKVLKCGG